MGKGLKVTVSKKSKKKGPGKGNGDIPPPRIYDVVTQSGAPPNVSESTVVRALATTTITAVANASVKPTFSFTLAGTNVGAGFFDQYKIEYVRFIVSPQNNAIGLFTNSAVTVLPMYIVIDYDDAAALASAGAATSYANCVVLQPGKSTCRGFQPRMAVSAYAGGFGGFANMADQWIDAASTGVNHYGIKTWVEPAAVGQTQLQVWDVSVEYFIRFRKAI